MTLKHIIPPANPFSFVKDHIYSKYNAEYILLKSLFLAGVSSDQIEKIELATLDQAGSDLWHELRRVRLTASRFYECCQNLTADQGKKIALKILNPKKFTSRPTSHGTLHEKDALKDFEKVMLQGQLPVVQCGLMLDKEYPFIAASPDGLLGELTAVEIKCPYTSRYEIAHEGNVECLQKFGKNGLQLKTNHRYYYQVQGQLMVTGKLFCDFLVYTYKSLIRITVKRDEAFITEMRAKLVDFYDEYMRPAILNKYLYRDYDSIVVCKCCRQNPISGQTRYVNL